MCKHYDCQYYCPDTGTCDYMLISGKPRGCAPTNDCDKHCTNPDEMVILRKRFYKPRVVDHEGIRRMEKCYVKDMETKALAFFARVSVREALYWTRKVHPDSIVLQPWRRMKG